MMIFITRFIWLWAKRSSISWGTQQRDDSPLSWAECFGTFGWVAAFGVGAWIVLMIAISRISSVSSVVVNTVSGGWISPTDLLLWYSPILGGFAFSIWIARFTSLTFPRMNARRLFATPEEIKKPPVIADLLVWHDRFKVALPDAEEPGTCARYALGNAFFYINHRSETRSRPVVAKWLLPHIRSGAALSPRQLLLALGERSCFDEVYRQNAQNAA